MFLSATYKDYAAMDPDTGTFYWKPATMGGFRGSHPGLIDLMPERDGGALRIAGSMSESRPVSARNENRTVTALVEDDVALLASVQCEHDETLACVRRAVGKTDAPLHSYFALMADDPSVQIVSIAQTWYIAKMMKGTEFEGLPVLSAAAPCKATGGGGPDYYTDVPRVRTH